MCQTIEESIQTIVRKVPDGLLFDSHFVIDSLIRDHGDIYLAFAATITVPTTAAVHGQIAQLIHQFADIQPDEVFSINIRENGSKCALWRPRP